MTREEMEAVLAFKHRPRLTQFAKQLLALPCFSDKAVESIRTPCAEQCIKRDLERRRAACYANLSEAGVTCRLRLLDKQKEALEISVEEDSIEVVDITNRAPFDLPGLPPHATFAEQTVYGKPSAFI